VDTLDNVGLHTSVAGTTADLFGSVSEENVARIKRQNSKRISVIIGNPPYNANQANENDNNKNREYPAIDKRIKTRTSMRAPRRKPSSTTCMPVSFAGPATD
jgi:predicted helicase